MTAEEAIREYITPQCGVTIGTSCKVIVVKSEDDRALVESSVKEQGLTEVEYTIIASPELIEKLQYPEPVVLKKAPDIEMKDCTGYVKQQQCEARQHMKEQNKLRIRYFNKSQRFNK